MSKSNAERLIHSRRDLMASLPPSRRTPGAAEGGCGVLGLASSEPVPGRHVLTATLDGVTKTRTVTVGPGVQFPDFIRAGACFVLPIY